MVDAVFSPPHYTQGGLEVIDIMEAKMSPDDFRAYLYGNVLKYLLRCKYKGKEVEDLRKALWYLGRLVSNHEDPSPCQQTRNRIQQEARKK